mmetsp:Transcript_1876/g.2947  ORF Transcript_1876/g.2947 Transcript_1876/m.2947 type:complete len:393 (-) Transcript_1876:127-1305(-)
MANKSQQQERRQQKNRWRILGFDPVAASLISIFTLINLSRVSILLDATVLSAGWVAFILIMAGIHSIIALVVLVAFKWITHSGGSSDPEFFDVFIWMITKVFIVLPFLALGAELVISYVAGGFSPFWSAWNFFQSNIPNNWIILIKVLGTLFILLISRSEKHDPLKAGIKLTIATIMQKFKSIFISWAKLGENSPKCAKFPENRQIIVGDTKRVLENFLSSNSPQAILSISATNLRRPRRMSLFALKPSPYFKIYVSSCSNTISTIASQAWKLVTTTEVIKSSSNPKWCLLHVNLNDLCRGNRSNPLLFKCFHTNNCKTQSKTNNDFLLGEFRTSIDELESLQPEAVFKLVKLKDYNLNAKRKDRGAVKIVLEIYKEEDDANSPPFENKNVT